MWMTMPLILQVVQKIQYNAKDVPKQHQFRCPKLVFIEWPTDQASWVPDATWLRMEPQARSWQLELLQYKLEKWSLHPECSLMQFMYTFAYWLVDYRRVWFSMMRDAALVSVSFQDWVHSTQAPKSHAVFTVVQCAKSWHLLSTAGWCRRSSALRCLWPNSSHHACLPWIIFFLLLRAGGLVLNFIFNCRQSVETPISSGRSFKQQFPGRASSPGGSHRVWASCRFEVRHEMT